MTSFVSGDVHYWFNAFEAGFWIVVGVILIVASRHKAGRLRRIGTLAGLAFLAFAGTDLIELRTGAWYRPRWLLVYNAACITTFVVCYGLYRRECRRLS